MFVFLILYQKYQFSTKLSSKAIFSINEKRFFSSTSERLHVTNYKL